MFRSRPTKLLPILPAEGPDARLYEMAIRTAIEMVSADGGSIATLNEDRTAMVLRVREAHPRYRPDPVRAAPKAEAAIESVTTTHLPVVQIWRYYRRGERLIGYTWMIGAPIILSGQEVQGLAGNANPEEPDAAYHLAVPIFAALPNDGGQVPVDPPIIGVLAVYVTDARWQFHQNHIRLLEAQAINIAQSIQLQQQMREAQDNSRLIALMQEMVSNSPEIVDIEQFYIDFFKRIANTIGKFMPVTAFATMLTKSTGALSGSRPLHDAMLTLSPIFEGDNMYPAYQVRENEPVWWQRVSIGQTFQFLNDDEHIRYAQLSIRDWGSKSYLDSQLYIPMKTSGNLVVGALIVGSNRIHAYTPAHIQLLEMVARFAGQAVENVQMRTSLAARAPHPSMLDSAQSLAVLNNSLLGLNATLDADAVIHNLVEQASELARGQICGFLEYDRMQDMLVVRDVAETKSHIYGESLNVRIPVGQGRLRAAINGETVRLEHLDLEYEREDGIGPLLQRYAVKAMQLVPIVHQGPNSSQDRVIGLLGIYARDQDIFFTPRELMNFNGLCHVAAAALHNARTYAQLRELDALKDDFILTASHEFRTPMSAIQGFSWLLQRRNATMTPEQAHHWSTEIIRATEQLKDMMDTITEAWRTRSVQQPPPQPVRVSDAYNVAMEVLGPQLAAENQIIQADIPKEFWVIGEADRLRHVFSNLLTNASKYSPQQTRITVVASIRSGAELVAWPRERGARNDEEPSVVHVTVNSGPWVVISVHDEGKGISLADQKRIFAKFVRLTLTTSVRGTGLGLYICRRYIEDMGGEIWVESAPGQGSTFSFCLPFAESPEMAS